MTYKYRFLANKIKDSLQQYAVVNVIGPRQCGKTSLIQHLFPDWNYFSLDNYDHYRLVLSDTVGFFGRYPEKVIIDEAQLLPDICSVLKQWIESGSQKVSQIILISSTRLKSLRKTESTKTESIKDQLTRDKWKKDQSAKGESKHSEYTSSKIRRFESKDSRLKSFELKNPDLGNFDSGATKLGKFELNSSESRNPELKNSELSNFGLEKSGLIRSGEIPFIELWPFKMAEYYSQEFPQIYEILLKKQTMPSDFLQLKGNLTLQEVYEHWLYGGFPEPRFNCREDMRFRSYWMNEYLRTHLRTDIQNKFPRLNYQKFGLFIAVSLQHSGRLINHSRIARSLELSTLTIQQYFEVLQQTGVWKGLNSFKKSATKTIKKAPKGYFRDSGILNHHLRISDVDQLLTHPQAEAGFESFAAEELIRGVLSHSKQSYNFSHLQTKDGSGISLIIENSQRLVPILIQLGRKVDKRKLRAIQDFVQEHNCNFGLLVNSASTVEVLDEKIVQIPVNCI